MHVWRGDSCPVEDVVLEIQEQHMLILCNMYLVGIFTGEKHLFLDQMKEADKVCQ